MDRKQDTRRVNSSLKIFFRFVLKKSWNQDVVPRMINDHTIPHAKLKSSGVEMMLRKVGKETRVKHAHPHLHTVLLGGGRRNDGKRG